MTSLKPIGPLLPIGPRTGVIYSGLFKLHRIHDMLYREQHWAPHLLRPVLSTYSLLQIAIVLITKIKKIGLEASLE